MKYDKCKFFKKKKLIKKKNNNNIFIIMHYVYLMLIESWLFWMCVNMTNPLFVYI